MSFTILFAALALLLLGIIFGLTYYLKGLKSALIVTGIAFILLVVILVVLIGVIVNAMPN